MNNSKLPKYQVVKEYLKRLALSEQEGFRIPTIEALNKQYGVSSTTTLKAVNELINEGHLETIQGNGTFVVKPLKDKEVSTSNNIGLFLPVLVDIHHPISSLVIRTTTSVANEHGYNIVILPEDNKQLFGPRSARFEEELHSGYYAGLLLAGLMGVEDFGRLFSYDIPFVNISNEYHDNRIYSVSMDNYSLAYSPAKYCVDKGCKNILFLPGPSSSYAVNMYLNAYKMCLRERGLELSQENIQMTDFDEGQAYDYVMKRFSSKVDIPDAVVAIDGTLARGAYYAMENLGLSIPDDVILIQGTELFSNQAMRKSVSYIDVHYDRICRKSTEKVIKLIKGEEVAETIEYVYPTLMECPRASAKQKQLI
jgi:DNA-binding LacI/PurR family transcriptional regulator